MLFDWNFEDIKTFFKAAFQPITIKFNWDFFLALVGTYLGVISLVKSKKVKRFELYEAKTHIESEITDEIRSKVKITYKDKQVDLLFKTVIFLRNSGNIELKKEDFNTDCILSFNDHVELLESTIYSSDAFTVIKTFYNENKLYMKICFIEPKAFIKVETLYNCSKTPKATLIVNIVSGEKNVYKLETFNNTGDWILSANNDSTILMLWGGICFGFLLIVAFFIARTLGIPISNPFHEIMIPSGWSFLIYLVSTLPAYWLWKKAYPYSIFEKSKWASIKEWTVIEHFEK